MSEYSEDNLVEQPAISLFAELGWQAASCFYETYGPGGTLGRETTNEVVLVPKLRAALEKLNSELPQEAIGQAIEELTRNRGTVTAVNANREIYKLLKDGVPVRFQGPDGKEETTERVRVVDWNKPANNDFFLASQLWISGEIYKRRTDLVGFVNGLPLVFVK